MPSRGATVGVEDSLDGPLVDLTLLIAVGERRNDAGRFEPVYAFRREAKPEITPALFDYCLMDFWKRFRGEEILSLRAATLGPGSAGQVFKPTEDDVRARILRRETDGRDSAPALQLVRCTRAAHFPRRKGTQSHSPPSTFRGSAQCLSQPPQRSLLSSRSPTAWCGRCAFERDFADPAALDNYVITPDMAQAFQRIAAGMRANSSQRAWRVTGDYGVGKSSFALVLAHLLSNPGGSSAARIAQGIGWPQEQRPVSPFLVTGSRESLAAALARGLAEGLERRRPAKPSKPWLKLLAEDVTVEKSPERSRARRASWPGARAC